MITINKSVGAHASITVIVIQSIIQKEEIIVCKTFKAGSFRASFTVGEFLRTSYAFPAAHVCSSLEVGVLAAFYALVKGWGISIL